MDQQIRKVNTYGCSPNLKVCSRFFSARYRSINAVFQALLHQTKNSRCLVSSSSDGCMMISSKSAEKTSKYTGLMYWRNFLNSLLLLLDRFIVRDFVYSEDEISRQKQELEMAGTTEKELWVRMLLTYFLYEYPLLTPLSTDRASATCSYQLL